MRADLTQEQLARVLGTTLQYVQRLEAGRNLTLHSLAKIANGLGVSVADLFVTTDYRRSTKAGRPRAKRRPA